jgi:hypothetical protein
VLSAPDYVSVSIDKDGRTLRAKVKDDAPWGLHESGFHQTARQRTAAARSLGCRQERRAR